MKNPVSKCFATLLALLLAIDTAAACRWLRSCSACQPAPVCCEPEPVCCTPAPACGEVVVTSAHESDCGCSSTVTKTTVHESTASPTLAAPPKPTLVQEPTPAAPFGAGFRSDNPEPTAAPPADDWDAGLDEPAPVVQQPAEPLPPAAPVPAEPPAEDLFAAPAEPIEEPADDLFGAEPVAAEEPADDLFGAEPVEEPMAEPADDLFGDEPAFEEPAAEDDLFGDAPVEEPMTEESDDLFGDDAGFEDAPAEDDLFGDEPAVEEPPVMEEEAPAAEDDLFGGDDAFGEEAPADDAEEDLFGGFGDEEDDLFGDPPMEEAPAEGDSPPSDDSIEDDLFGGFGAILREPGGVESSRDRTWIDNTGRFSTVGRLLAIDAGEIRLVKPTGAIATVPLGRLSQADLEFVSRQSLAQSEAKEWAIAHGERPAESQQANADDDSLRTAQL